jgi:hypothetical protein
VKAPLRGPEAESLFEPVASLQALDLPGLVFDAELHSRPGRDVQRAGLPGEVGQSGRFPGGRAQRSRWVTLVPSVLDTRGAGRLVADARQS